MTNGRITARANISNMRCRKFFTRRNKKNGGHQAAVRCFRLQTSKIKNLALSPDAAAS
jgi:hypothetical protein